MYQQLSAWVLHGIHIDKHNEFFIKEATSADDQTVNKTDEGAASSSSDLGIPGITGRQLTEILVRTNAWFMCAMQMQAQLQIQAQDKGKSVLIGEN